MHYHHRWITRDTSYSSHIYLKNEYYMWNNLLKFYAGCEIWKDCCSWYNKQMIFCSNNNFSCWPKRSLVNKHEKSLKTQISCKSKTKGFKIIYRLKHVSIFLRLQNKHQLLEEIWEAASSSWESNYRDRTGQTTFSGACPRDTCYYFIQGYLLLGNYAEFKWFLVIPLYSF